MTDRDSSPPRRFALLGRPAGRGVHSLWPSLLFKSDDHSVVAVVYGSVGGIPTYPDWRSLLESDAKFDAVLVDGDSPEVHQAMRELAARGFTLAVPIDRNLPAELVAELSLYDSEGTTTLLPLWTTRLTPGLHDLHTLMAAGRLGEVIRLELRTERSAPTPDQWAENPGDHNLLTAIDTLRMLGGDYSQVTFLRTGVRDSRFATQTLQLSGAGLPDGTSSLDLAADENRSRIRIEGTKSSALLRLADGSSTLEINGQQVSRTETTSAGADDLLRMIDTVALRQPGAPQWRDVTRAFEIMEAAGRSLRRRRTIDLHFETTSEQSQFKTHMAAIGCAVILWTMFGLIGMLFVGATLDPRDRAQVQAEAAGFVLRADEFLPGDQRLTVAGDEHVQRIATQLGRSDALVIVEPVSREWAITGLDGRRQALVQASLQAAGASEGDRRVVIRPLEGQWFTQAMTVGWVLVFGPVGVFLLLQVLLVIAKPAAATRADDQPS